MQNEKNDFSVAAFIIGGILGASASLLLTPKSGKNLRGEIKYQANNYLNEARNLSNDLVSKSRTTAEFLNAKQRILRTVLSNIHAERLEIHFQLLKKK